MDQQPAHDIIAPAVEAAQSVARPVGQQDHRRVDDDPNAAKFHRAFKGPPSGVPCESGYG